MENQDSNSWLLQVILTICLLAWNWTLRFPFIKIPVTPVPLWDKEKLAGLVLRGQGRARFLEDAQRDLQGLVLGSNLSQPHLSAEEYWNQLSGAVRRAGQPLRQVTRKRLERPQDTLFCGASFVLWRDLYAFWTARRKLDVLTRRDRQRSQEATIRSFQTAWDKRKFSEIWGLALCLTGRPVGHKKRVYYQRASSSLSVVQECPECLSLAGHLGGSGAQVANRMFFAVSQRISWQKAWFLGCQDCVERSQRARSFHVRKAIPSW